MFMNGCANETLRKLAHAINRDIFSNFQLKIFYIFAEAVLTCTRNLCHFGAKIRKIGIPLHTPVLLYESGVQGGKRLLGHVFLMMNENNSVFMFKYEEN